MLSESMEKKLNLLLQRVRETRDEEISCDECLDRVSRFVDLDLTRQEAASIEMPEVKHHLDQCTICQEEYQILRQLAWLEAEGEAPEIQDLLDQLC